VKATGRDAGGAAVAQAWRVAALLAVVAVLAAGCGGDDDGTATTDSTASTTTAAGDPTTTASGSTTTVVDDVELLLVLTPDGVGFTTADSGSINRVDFGSAQELTVDLVTKSLGEPSDVTSQPECPPGPAEEARFDGIVLTFQEGSFVGWSVGKGSTLTTVDGIGVGSTLTELRAAFADVEQVESSLGVEVLAGGYDILLSDDTDQGEVDSMLAGANCVFR
jgi:hypothetical protein